MNERERADAVYDILLTRQGEQWVQPRIERTQKLLDYLDNPQRTYRVVHVTGTNGKTSTKDLLSHVLSASMNVMSTKGNFNSTVGVPLSIFECGESAEVAIIEMGASKPGEIEYICNIARPDMGIITNIYEAHLEYFGDIEEVAKTKSALFSSLPKTGTAFINKDDAFISKMSVSCNRIEYSFSKSTDYNGRWSVDNKIITINF